MKKLIPALILMLALPALAETAHFKIKGMHCGACVESMKTSVCDKLEGMTCEASLGKTKKEKKDQIGDLTVTTPDGIPVDMAKVKALVAASGEFTIAESTKK